MKKVKVGINGMGRIGRTILRQYLDRQHNDIEIVAANDLGKIEQAAHLLKYDSVHGQLNHDVKVEKDQIHCGTLHLKYFSVRNPSEIPWGELGVEIVIDCTGIFKDKEGLGKHMHSGVKKVIMCAPGKDLDATFVMGINHHLYDNNKHHIISNASCTTNCLAPLVKVLHESFGVESGQMVTVHSYTSDQQLLDGLHSDPRRARSAALSMCPTTTGAAKAVAEVIPELKGKLDGYSVRVPTPNVSMVDFTVNLKKPITKESINQALKNASEGALKGILSYTTEELVSVDFNGNKHSSIVDSSLTNVIGQTAKVISWYDNESGFSNRVIDLAHLLASKL